MKVPFFVILSKQIDSFLKIPSVSIEGNDYFVRIRDVRCIYKRLVLQRQKNHEI